MKKIFNLIINENIKLLKKKSVVVLVIVAILSLLGSVALTFYSRYSSNLSKDRYSNMWKEIITSQVDSFQGEKASLESVINKTEEDIVTICDLQARIEMYKYSIENNIDIYTNNSWETELIENIISKKSDLFKLKYYNNSQKDIDNVNLEINDLYDILNTKNFDKYVENKIDVIETEYKNKYINEKEYNDKLYIEQLIKKYDIGKDNNLETSWKNDIIVSIQRLKESLRNGIDIETNKMLTNDKTKEVENNILMAEYRLEHDIPLSNSQNGTPNFRSIYNGMAESFSMGIIAILLIISASGAISQEISNGTIKFLVMTPNKRWKILFAKLLNLIFILIITTLIVSLISISLEGIFFSKYQAEPYLYVSGGAVHSINHVAYTILRYLTCTIDIFVFSLLALMLSVVSRNTAFSVSIGVGLYMGSGILMSILNMLIKSDWMKFVPLNNIGFTSRIFSNSTSLVMNLGESSLNIGVGFSLIVIAICCILMLVTMFDSFNKRDLVQ